jgi:phosphate transport system substrate-binding protein
MKKLIPLQLLFLLATGMTTQKSDLIIKGSDTMLPLSHKLSEAFASTRNDLIKISVAGGGSGIGISALMDGTTDIAQCSRSLNESEVSKFQAEGKSYKEIPIALDALAVVVNPANNVQHLTREQLEGIFSGNFKNWNEVGGVDMPIVTYGRESSSGTHDFFKEHVMNGTEFSASTVIMPETEAIIMTVASDKGAIGYVGLAYADKNVKTLGVSYDQGKSYVLPSLITAQNKTYPIVRSLFYYYMQSEEDKVKTFIAFVLSPEGQRVVKKVGYIPLY